MRILFIGDIVGSSGRQIVRDRLADLVTHRQIDLVIANGENSASGFGITPKIADDLLSRRPRVLRGLLDLLRRGPAGEEGESFLRADY